MCVCVFVSVCVCVCARVCVRVCRGWDVASVSVCLSLPLPPSLPPSPSLPPFLPPSLSFSLSPFFSLTHSHSLTPTRPYAHAREQVTFAAEHLELEQLRLWPVLERAVARERLARITDSYGYSSDLPRHLASAARSIAMRVESE